MESEDGEGRDERNEWVRRGGEIDGEAVVVRGGRRGD